MHSNGFIQKQNFDLGSPVLGIRETTRGIIGVKQGKLMFECMDGGE